MISHTHYSHMDCFKLRYHRHRVSTAMDVSFNQIEFIYNNPHSIVFHIKLKMMLIYSFSLRAFRCRCRCRCRLSLSLIFISKSSIFNRYRRYSYGLILFTQLITNDSLPVCIEIIAMVTYPRTAHTHLKKKKTI